MTILAKGPGNGGGGAGEGRDREKAPRNASAKGERSAPTTSREKPASTTTRTGTIESSQGKSANFTSTDTREPGGTSRESTLTKPDGSTITNTGARSVDLKPVSFSTIGPQPDLREKRSLAPAPSQRTLTARSPPKAPAQESTARLLM